MIETNMTKNLGTKEENKNTVKGSWGLKLEKKAKLERNNSRWKRAIRVEKYTRKLWEVT